MKHKRLFFWCYLSIILAVVAILATFIRITPTVTTTGETFIGVIVSLLGICVTFAIGFQIYNALEIKEKVNKMKELDEELKITKDELKKAKSDLDKYWYVIKIENENYRALNSLRNKLYIDAICQNTTGLLYSIKCEDGAAIDTFLSESENILRIWDSEPINESQYFFEHRGMHPLWLTGQNIDLIIKEGKDNKLYKIIEKRFLEIKRRFEEKVKEYENTESTEK